MTVQPSEPDNGKLAGWLGGVGIALMFVALRWNSCTAPLIRDEGEYAYAARLLTHGVAPYEHAFIQKPPLVIYSYALAQGLLPQVSWAPRLLAYGFVALATLLLGYIARLEFGRGVALASMALATPMILQPGLGQFAANTEMFLLLPLLATVAVYCHSRQRGDPPMSWLAAGFLGVTTLLYKYTALPVLAFVFAVWSVEIWRRHRDVRRLARGWLWGLLGGLAAATVFLGFFWLHDGGAALWECTVRFNRFYARSGNFGLAALAAQFGKFFPAWWILFALPWAAWFRPNARPWFWFGLLAAALAATNASFYGHYYIVVMPFWALLSAAGLGVLAEAGARWLKRPAPILRRLLTGLAVILLLLPDARWIAASPTQFAETKLGPGGTFLGSAAVARRIAAASAPDDPVFIAGSEPQILCYADRGSPTRFITLYALMIPTPLARDYQREAMRDLQAHPPAWVVFASTDGSWLREPASPPDFLDFLGPWLERNYELVGGYVAAGPSGRWVEPLTSGDLAASSLLLYRSRDRPANPATPKQ